MAFYICFLDHGLMQTCNKRSFISGFPATVRPFRDTGTNRGMATERQSAGPRPMCGHGKGGARLRKWAFHGRNLKNPPSFHLRLHFLTREAHSRSGSKISSRIGGYRAFVRMCIVGKLSPKASPLHGRTRRARPAPPAFLSSCQMKRTPLRGFCRCSLRVALAGPVIPRTMLADIKLPHGRRGQRR